uniref:Uncharacterized protein n=1 Tax=Schistocephalus solidus TaxID=70667 RepID=A0A0X3P5W1_SCHSO
MSNKRALLFIGERASGIQWPKVRRTLLDHSKYSLSVDIRPAPPRSHVDASPVCPSETRVLYWNASGGPDSLSQLLRHDDYATALTAWLPVNGRLAGRDR